MLILPALLFFLSTLGCGLAPDMKSFIAARGVAGLGAGGLMSVSAVIISDIVKIEYRGIYRKSIFLFSVEVHKPFTLHVISATQPFRTRQTEPLTIAQNHITTW